MPGAPGVLPAPAPAWQHWGRGGINLQLTERGGGTGVLMAVRGREQLLQSPWAVPTPVSSAGTVCLLAPSCSLCPGQGLPAASSSTACLSVLSLCPLCSLCPLHPLPFSSLLLVSPSSTFPFSPCVPSCAVPSLLPAGALCSEGRCRWQLCPCSPSPGDPSPGNSAASLPWQCPSIFIPLQDTPQPPPAGKLLGQGICFSHIL